jgi:methylenetetrahydrofolate dehydrogenase (NADP+)/methenyltetrahydrofolate cyclohydrolase
VIDGNAEAAELGTRVAAHARRITQARGRKPSMAVVMVGEDAAGEVYARNKVSQAAKLGIEVPATRLPAQAAPLDLRNAVAKLNADDAVDAILVQLPLPAHLDEDEVVAAIAPEKDVDGMHPLNLGLLASGRPSVVPCTANACVLLARKYGGDLSGRAALVVGRSAVVGRPLGHLLLAENCTVTTAHSATRDLAGQVGRADILVSATGRAELIKGAWIKPGALVIDVGTARIEGADGRPRYVGDVEFESAKEKAAAITPVPGGVGPMTVACLLWNTVLLAGRRAGLGDIE